MSFCHEPKTTLSLRNNGTNNIALVLEICSRLRSQDVIERIAANPSEFPAVHGEIRRAIMRQFPYGIYFRLYRQTIVVLAVMHGHRHPARWQSRGYAPILTSTKLQTARLAARRCYVVYDAINSTMIPATSSPS